MLRIMPCVHRMLLALAILLVAAPLLAAPDRAPSRKTAAKVLLIEGHVLLTRKGKAVAMRDNDELRRSDWLKTDVDAFVILKLRNDHLVRIDEDLRLQVKQIAVLASKRSDTPLEAQLGALLYPDEQEAFLDRGLSAVRAAGWRVGTRAIDAVPASPARSPRSQAAPMPPRRSATPQGVGPAKKSSAPLPPRPAADLHDETKAKAAKPQANEVSPPAESKLNEGPFVARKRRKPATGRGQATPPPSDSTDEPPAKVSNREAIETSISQTPRSPVQALLWKSVRTDRALRRCLFSSRPRRVSKITLFLKVHEGKITRLRLSRARPVPACARERLLDRALTLPRRYARKHSGWLPLDLKRP